MTRYQAQLDQMVQGIARAQRDAIQGLKGNQVTCQACGVEENTEQADKTRWCSLTIKAELPKIYPGHHPTTLTVPLDQICLACSQECQDAIDRRIFKRDFPQPEEGIEKNG